MGWLFAPDWRRHADLQRDIKRDAERGPSKYLMGELTKNETGYDRNWWTLWESEVDGKTARFVVLFLIDRNENGWLGYKDVSSDMGPNEVNCPLAFIDEMTPAMNKHDAEWRQRVRDYHEHRIIQKRLQQ